MSLLRVKGTAFRQVLDTYREVSGGTFADEVVRALPGPCGEAVRQGTLLAASWHPIDWYAALLRTGTDRSGQGLPYALQIGRRSAERDIGSVHRLVFRLLSTETIVRQIPRILGLYFDGGQGQLESTTKDARGGTFRIAFEGMDGFDDVVWHDFLGGTEAMLAATSAKDVRGRFVRGGRGPDALIELRYSL